MKTSAANSPQKVHIAARDRKEKKKRKREKETGYKRNVVDARIIVLIATCVDVIEITQRSSCIGFISIERTNLIYGRRT